MQLKPHHLSVKSDLFSFLWMWRASWGVTESTRDNSLVVLYCHVQDYQRKWTGTTISNLMDLMDTIQHLSPFMHHSGSSLCRNAQGGRSVHSSNSIVYLIDTRWPDGSHDYTNKKRNASNIYFITMIYYPQAIICFYITLLLMLTDNTALFKSWKYKAHPRGRDSKF